MSTDPDQENSDRVREVADRAIRRLNLLEHVFLFVAAGASLVAGLLVAWLLNQSVGVPVRPTWALSALVLFLLPAAISVWRVRRDDREHRERMARSRDETESSSDSHENA